MSDKEQIPFAQTFETYRQNVMPGMLSVLAEQLGVSAKSLEAIGVGYTFATQSWVTPERDENGEIIGLVQRSLGGKKIAIKGSKRGLCYVFNPDFKSKSVYIPGKHNWIRVSRDRPCPLCSRTKWCMVSAENPADPAAVICGLASGAVAECGNGTYLHILKPEGDKRRNSTTVLAPTSSGPILIVEGFTDTAAGLDLGFTTIGKPAGAGGLKMLRQMPLSGRPIWVFGENDSGAGREGMERTFLALRDLSNEVVKVMPPAGIKDLRAWLQSGLTREALEEYVAKHGVTAADAAVLESDAPSYIAKVWLDENKVDGFPRIRRYAKDWFEYVDGHYALLDEDVLRGRVYSFLEGRRYKNISQAGDVTLVEYKANRRKVSDILDAANQWCPVDAEPPTWLDGQPHPHAIDLIPFQNGILDVKEYCEGNIVLYPPTPAFFSLNILPYDYDPDAHSDLWDEFLNDVFSGNQAKVALLAEWMGYNCVPDIYFEKMMLFHGPPRSGKSTVLEAMREMLGRHQCCEVTFQNLCSSFGYHAMVGKLAAMIGDAKTPRARESDAALEKILQITGGDPVNVQRKYRDDLASTKLYCRFTIAMNDLPAFTDHVKALEPRLNILAFENSYVGREDRSLKHRICQEAKAGKLINFALQGLKRLRAQQKFTEPLSSQQLADQFRLIATPIYAFLDECCELAPTVEERKDYVELKDVLFQVWKRWCEDNGRSYGMKQQFGAKLNCIPSITSSRIRINGEPQYVYQGVRLTQQAKITYLG